MARGGRGGDGGDSPPSGGRPGRPHGGGNESVAAAQETVSAEAHQGRQGGGNPASGPGSAQRGGGRPDGQTDDLVTHPTGEPGGTPGGEPTRVGPNQDDDVRRSLERENSGAAILADNGHQVRQNPSAAEVAQARQVAGDSGRPTSRPDYLIEGRVFDCYSPSENKGVRGIWSEVETKIKDDQTQRVVVNLEDWRGNLPDLRQQFKDWPIENLKEVKVITPDGEVVQLTPNPEDG